MEEQQPSLGQTDQINHYGRPTSRQRRSLLIGINYEGQEHALQGCRQDARNMVSSKQSSFSTAASAVPLAITDIATASYRTRS